MAEIYCVKLKQLRLDGGTQTFEYFPFDRFYLIPKTHRKLATSLFRYSLILKVDDVIKKSLNRIRFESQRKIGLKRDNDALKWQRITDGNLPEIKEIEEGEWLLVVPTYLARDKEIDPESKKPVTRKVRLAYTLSHAVSDIHNLSVPMPTVFLHTPKEDIPVICAICKHVADYHANKCTPGQARCRRNIELTRLPVDEEFREVVETSIKGGGEIE
ncbi:MAG: hypothetical protein DRP83_00350 [Planctomycetota bacterium]|nr:MAG: hypothetical protein DRP83_00350 [Planctomycetota bacterium]